VKKTANALKVDELHLEENNTVQLVDVALIDPSPVNKRGEMNIDDLAKSIKEQGLLNAVIVRRHPRKKGRYELVCGERRWRAFKKLKEKQIPAVIRCLSEVEAHEITGSENILRQDLTVIEESETIKQLIKDGQTPEQIAQKWGKSVTWVARRSLIGDLIPEWMTMVKDQTHPVSKWSASHLELIARYSPEEQMAIAKSFVFFDATISLGSLEGLLQSRSNLLKAAPWNLYDETLSPTAGSCNNCQKRSSCEPTLFPEEYESGESDRCLDTECWKEKLFLFHKKKISGYGETYPNLVLLDKGSLPSDMAPAFFEKEILRLHEVEFVASKKDENAIPAYTIDGPGSGRIQWVKKAEHLKNHKKVGRPKKEPQTPEEAIEGKREAFEKKRLARYFAKVISLLTNLQSNIYNDAERCGQITSREILSLALAFGTAKYDYNEAALDSPLTCLERYDKIMQDSDDALHAKMIAAVIKKMIEKLEGDIFEGFYDLQSADKICHVLMIDSQSMWEEIEVELPWPKALQNKPETQAT
jgi:ParB/RepB/Spo0J family partition protein